MSENKDKYDDSKQVLEELSTYGGRLSFEASEALKRWEDPDYLDSEKYADLHYIQILTEREVKRMKEEDERRRQEAEEDKKGLGSK